MSSEARTTQSGRFEVLATLGGVELALDMSGEQVDLGSGVAAAQRWFQEDGW